VKLHIIFALKYNKQQTTVAVTLADTLHNITSKILGDIIMDVPCPIGIDAPGLGFDKKSCLHLRTPPHNSLLVLGQFKPIRLVHHGVKYMYYVPRLMQLTFVENHKAVATSAIPLDTTVSTHSSVRPFPLYFLNRVTFARL